MTFLTLISGGIWVRWIDEHDASQDTRTGEHRDEQERKHPGREDQIVAECHFQSGQPKSTP